MCRQWTRRFSSATRDQELAEIAEFPVNASSGIAPEMQARLRALCERLRLLDKVAQFFADEKVAAVIEPSRDGKNGGGSGGTLFDDNGATLGRTPYIAEKRVKVPVAVAAIESYGRLYRLVQAHVPVTRRDRHRNQIHWANTSTASTPSPRFPAPTQS